MINLYGIKARPHDIDSMLVNKPSLVELHCSIDDLKWIPEKNYNIPFAVHLPEYHNGHLIDPACIDEGKREYAQDLYSGAIKTAISWTRFFNGQKPKIVFHPGGMSVHGLSSMEKIAAGSQLDKTIDGMIAAAGDDADVLIENVPAHCWFFGGEWLASLCTGADDMVSVCKKHGIGMTLDLCHLYLASRAQGFNLEDAIEKMKPYTKHVHYSGAEGVDGEGLDITAGTFNVGHSLFHLKDINAIAVPEIWFGHEHGGAGFKKAWIDAAESMSAAQAPQEAAWQS